MRRIQAEQASPSANEVDFALDHLTVIETTPRELAETASEAGYGRICTFVRSIDGLGGPTFDLTQDRGARFGRMRRGRAGMFGDFGWRCRRRRP